MRERESENCRYSLISASEQSFIHTCIYKYIHIFWFDERHVKNRIFLKLKKKNQKNNKWFGFDLWRIIILIFIVREAYEIIRICIHFLRIETSENGRRRGRYEQKWFWWRFGPFSWFFFHRIRLRRREEYWPPVSLIWIYNNTFRMNF